MQFNANPFFEDREDHGEPGWIHPAGDPSRVWPGAGCNKRLYLDWDCAPALDCEGDAGAAHLGVGVADEQFAWIRHLDDAGFSHLETADLVGCAEAVFQGSEEAQRGLFVALEVADNINQVFECAGACDRAVFCDVADDNNRCAAIYASP